VIPQFTNSTYIPGIGHFKEGFSDKEKKPWKPSVFQTPK
jgi:hypothetical protein